MSRLKYVLGFALFSPVFTACKIRTNSRLRNAEGNIVVSLPPYVWHQTTPQELAEQLKGNNPKILSPDLPINKRLQEIANAIDNLLRTEYPEQTTNIPPPRILIYVDREINGRNQSKTLYLPQLVRTQAKAASKKDRTIGLNAPGFLIETALPTRPRIDDLVFRQAAQLKGWNPAEFVTLWNQKLPIESKGCPLSYVEGAFEFPATPECTKNAAGQFDYISFGVHTDVILLSTELLKSANEASVIPFLAHEFGHYYQGQAASIGHNPEYFYIQTPENQLKRPEPTTLYPEIRKALMQGKDIYPKVQPIPGASLSPNIFFAADGLYHDLAETICTGAVSCGSQLDELKSLYNDKVRPTIYEPLNEGKGIAAENYPTFIAFETLLFSVLNQVSVPTIQPDMLIQYRNSLRMFGLTDFFGPMPETKKIQPWLIDISRRVDQVVGAERPYYTKAAAVGLGYYTDEQLADELSAEISAKLGLGIEQITAAWWLLLTVDQKAERLTWQDMSVESCKALQAKNWQAESGQGYPLVLLGKLADIHHSFCYRIYNLEREWKAHNYAQKFAEVKRFPINENAWSTLIKSL